MTRPLHKISISPRFGFKFNKIPTKSAGREGGSNIRHTERDYAAILDCAYEMADTIAASNGVPPQIALTQVLMDEGWRILPTHQAAILSRIES